MATDALSLGVLDAELAAAPDSSPVLLPVAAAMPSSSMGLDALKSAVTCKNASMYGKKMRDVHIAGFSVKSEAVVRFRTSDDKVAVADVLVAVGRYGYVHLAHKAIYTMIEKGDDKVSDLDSLEVDRGSFEQKVCTLFNYIPGYYIQNLI